MHFHCLGASAANSGSGWQEIRAHASPSAEAIVSRSGNHSDRSIMSRRGRPALLSFTLRGPDTGSHHLRYLPDHDSIAS